MKINNIVEHFLKAAILYPNKIALQNHQESISYSELLNIVNAYTNQFNKKGIKQGDKILILHPLNFNLYAALLALLKLNCTLVFVEEWTNLKDISACQEKINCNYIISNFKINCIRFFIPKLNTIPHLSIKLKSLNYSNKITETKINQTAIISFSSGTSGHSKAIIRTHELLNAQFEALKHKIDIYDTPKMITNFPVVILLNLGLGITSYLSKNITMSNLPKTNFMEVYNEIKKNNITHLSFSPYLLNSLAYHIKVFKLPKLIVHQIISGGSPVFPSFAEAIVSSIASYIFTILYGSSEAEPIAYCNPYELIFHKDVQGLFVGNIDIHCQCKIGYFENNKFIENNQNIAGEIIVTGPHVVKQYCNSDSVQQENKVFMNNEIWHRTGDYGYFDENENLILTGDLNRKFNEQYLLEIEKKLHSIQGIQRATFIHNIAYVECFNQVDKKNIACKIQDLFPNVSNIKFVKLPLDRRHHGKIKYNNL